MRPNCQILPAALTAGAALSPGPLGPCHPSSASQSLPASPCSLSITAVIFFTSLHLSLSSSPSPPLSLSFYPLFSFSLHTCVLFPVPLFSSSVSVLQPIAIFVVLHLSVCLPIPILLFPPHVPFSPSQFPPPPLLSVWLHVPIF